VLASVSVRLDWLAASRRASAARKFQKSGPHPPVTFGSNSPNTTAGVVGPARQRNPQFHRRVRRERQGRITRTGKTRSGIACKRPADIGIGPRQQGIGERLAEFGPVGDREDMRLAAIARDFDQVDFGDGFRIAQNRSGDARLLVTGKPARCLPWRAGTSASVMLKCASVDVSTCSTSRTITSSKMPICCSLQRPAPERNSPVTCRNIWTLACRRAASDGPFQLCNQICGRGHGRQVLVHLGTAMSRMVELRMRSYDFIELLRSRL